MTPAYLHKGCLDPSMSIPDSRRVRTIASSVKGEAMPSSLSSPRSQPQAAFAPKASRQRTEEHFMNMRIPYDPGVGPCLSSADRHHASDLSLPAAQPPSRLGEGQHRRFALNGREHDGGLRWIEWDHPHNLRSPLALM